THTLQPVHALLLISTRGMRSLLFTKYKVKMLGGANRNDMKRFRQRFIPQLKIPVSELNHNHLDPIDVVDAREVLTNESHPAFGAIHVGSKCCFENLTILLQSPNF